MGRTMQEALLNANLITKEQLIRCEQQQSAEKIKKTKILKRRLKNKVSVVINK